MVSVCEIITFWFPAISPRVSFSWFFGGGTLASQLSTAELLLNASILLSDFASVALILEGRLWMTMMMFLVAQVAEERA